MAGRRDGPAGSDDRRLGLQQVLAGLDDQRVGPAAQQAGGVGLVGVAERGERDVAQGRQLRARAHRAEDPARPAPGRLVSRLPGDPRAGLGQLLDPPGDPVLAQVAEVRAESVGADAVDPGVQVAVVDGPDDVRAGHVQDLVAALMPVEIIQRGLADLQHGSHRAVRDNDPLAERRAQCGGPGGGGGREVRRGRAGLVQLAGPLINCPHDQVILPAAARPWPAPRGPGSGRRAALPWPAAAGPARMACRDMVIMIEHVIWDSRLRAVRENSQRGNGETRIWPGDPEEGAGDRVRRYRQVHLTGQSRLAGQAHVAGPDRRVRGLE